MGTQSHCPASLPSSCGSCYGHPTTISVLPDIVLLEIFDFYQIHSRTSSYYPPTWRWHVLAHVCQTWRQLVFASPHRLNLRILCTPRSPIRSLGIWPAFPIVIYLYSKDCIVPNNEDNLIAALKHVDRLWCVSLVAMGPLLERVVKVMQEPFPVLTRLEIILAGGGNAPVLPASFLGGSAPCLRELYLCGIPYPALPRLLLSTSDLVSLKLGNMTPTGYISPDVMVACLAALPRLEAFVIEFQSITPHPSRIRQPPVTRTVLPVLDLIRFSGASEYLEDLVSHIDSPQLTEIYISYLNEFTDIQVGQLSKLVHRSVGPELIPFGRVDISLFSCQVDFTLFHANNSGRDRRPGRAIIISCKGIEWQVSHMAHVLGQFSATCSTVVHLELRALFDLAAIFQEVGCLGDTDSFEWLHLLHPFSAVQSLCVSSCLSRHVAIALEGITGEMVAELLPSLDSICLAKERISSIEKFIAARRLSGRPVTIIGTEEFENRVKSYLSK